MLLQFFMLLLTMLCNGQHRAPPGVNPQQYHHAQSGQYQPPPPNVQQGTQGVPQYQQPSAQQQYQPPSPPQQQQYQQPPVQQQQQQQQQQQPAMQQPAMQQQRHQPGVEHNGAQQRVLHSVTNERDHIKDHLEVPLDTSGMTEEELQFHYFKMHDADNNNRLDGQELIKSLFHWHDASKHNVNSEHPPPGPKLFTDDELVNMIDPILVQDDKNKDGFIDYPEFVQAQRTAAASSVSNAV